MKRTRALLSCLLLAGLVACGDDDNFDPGSHDGGSSGTGGDAASGDASSGGGSGTGDGGADGGGGGSSDGGAGDATTGDGGVVDAGPSDECDPLTQNCSEADESCVISPTGGVHAVCARLVSPRGLNETCTGDCAEGLACVNSGGTATCQTICNYATISACPDGLECRGRFTGSDWGYCLALPVECSWADNTPCTSDQACQPVTSRETSTTEMRCRTAGTAQPGEYCGGTTNCVAGSACVNDSQGTRCREYCDADTDCHVSGETCSTATILGVNYCRADG